MPDVKFLKLLSEDYPNVKAATEEIINLSAILALPKGTEYFLSDLHGENEAFIHMIKSASGTIREKIEECYGRVLTEEDRYDLAALIYNAKAEIKRRKNSEINFDKWCSTVIYRLINICKSVSTKYTRSKVRRALPEYADYSLDELLHADDEENKTQYYNAIINTIVESGIAEEYIIDLSNVISRLAVDKLHIIGDVFDRGAHPDSIMDFLMDYHDNVDFQWGNHDVIWMGAAVGNWASICNILRINISYNNFDMLELGYSINLRPLATFAEKYYGKDSCDSFKLHLIESNKFAPIDENLGAKMHKAISICQFKIEGQKIKQHPEYELEHRLLLDKIDYEKGVIDIKGETYELKDNNFPTIDPEDPYKLIDDEIELMKALEASIHQSERLQRHIKFLYSNGSFYKKCNGNLLYHGCIPTEANGEFQEVIFDGKSYSGKSLFDYLESEMRKDHFTPDKNEKENTRGDIMWYLWLGPKSPLFAKDQMTTFERLFIADKKTHKEITSPYYEFIKEKSYCEKILTEFDMSPTKSKILNGHVPVKLKDGESPIRGGGLLYVIDGGISKAYHKKTGIAGYTFIFNSRFMALAEHLPYSPLNEDGTQEFHSPALKIVDTLSERMLVIDTDQGAELIKEVEDLKALIGAYKSGVVEERY